MSTLFDANTTLRIKGLPEMKLSVKLLTVLSNGAAQSYQDKVLAYSPVGYWPLNEASGTTATNYGSASSANGTHGASDIAGATIGPDGSSPAPLYVPADSDFTDIYSSGLWDGMAANMGEWSFSCWLRYDGAWDDATRRYFAFLEPDASPLLRSIFYKNSVINEMGAQQRSDGPITTTATATSLSLAGAWFHFGVSYSVINDEHKLSINGVLADTATGTAAFTLAAPYQTTQTVLANQSSSAPGSAEWHGSIAEVAMIPSVLTLGDFQNLATI